MSDSHSVENITYRRIAILFIIIGSLFAIDSFLELSFVYKLWPIVIAMLGVGLIGIYFKRKSRGALYLAIGEYLLSFSALALYCNFTSWRNMAWLWPLFIVFLGMNFVTLFLVDQKKRRFLLFIGLLLVSLAICFFLVFSVSGNLWWSIFILAGLSILLSGWLK
jgi:hypothetical protein